MSVLVVMSIVPLTLAGASSIASATSTASCRVPRLTGLTVTKARDRAENVGCRLRLVGAKVQVPMVQTIHTQSVRPGRLASVVTVSVNPLCSGSVNPGPPPNEPIIKAGPSELITGLFIEGGAMIESSAPHCKDLVGKSSAGTITVTNSDGSVIADNTALSAGQELYVNVPAGSYTVSGKFAGGEAVGPITVVVPTGKSVRQDLVLPVP
jgi:hypothetical protein